MKMHMADQDVSISGDFEKSEFAVGDLAFIVDMFADKVYVHKERAVIRELCCNAHDSHVMAGTKHIPFDVHLPTRLEPFFSVRDYGTGLSDREIRTVFAGVGISTKRDSNDVIGCFGIGSLSPYSLSDSFTVKSYHNGIVRTYTCYRDDQRRPVVAMLIEEETEEKNGLEVSVSIDGRIYDFEEEAKNVFRFWEGTLPNINNQQIVTQREEDDKKYILKGQDFGLTSTYGDMYAIMGNISYKIPTELCRIDCNGYIKFSLGELEFDTARENLSMTDKVKKAITAKFDEIKAKAATLAISQIEAESTVFKRAVLASRFNKGTLGNILKLNMKNYTLPDTSTDIECYESYYGRSARKIETKSIPLTSDRGNSKVEYYAHKPRMTQRIKDYSKNNSILVVVLTEQQIAECQIDRDLILDLDNLPKLQRANSSSSRSKSISTFKLNSYRASYSSYFTARCWDAVTMDVNGLDPSKEMVYVEINRYVPVHTGKPFISETLKLLDQMKIPSPTIYGLTGKYIHGKQFKSLNWISLQDYAKRELEKAVANKKIWKFDSNLANKVQAICDIVDSDSMTEWKEFQGQGFTFSDSVSESLIEHSQKMGFSLDEDDSVQEWMNKFFEKYSMLTVLDLWRIESNVGIVANYLGGKPKTA